MCQVCPSDMWVPVPVLENHVPSFCFSFLGFMLTLICLDLSCHASTFLVWSHLKQNWDEKRIRHIVVSILDSDTPPSNLHISSHLWRISYIRPKKTNMVNIQLKRDSADPVNYTNLSGSSPSDTSTAATSTFWSQHEYGKGDWDLLPWIPSDTLV